MNAICGPSSSTSSASSDPALCSASKSQAAPSSDRRCKGCSEAKTLDQFRRHNRGGRRWTCLACESGRDKKQYQRQRRMTHRGFSLVADAKSRAKAKRIPFSVDWREIQKRIDKGLCEATGIPFDLSVPKSWNAPSLDQIKPGLGYTPENTRVVLYALNVMANDWGQALILRIADALRARV